MELTVADAQKKHPAMQFVTEIESVRLSNNFIRTAWKSTALLIALTARLLTGIVLTIVRVVQRNRTNW